MSLIESSLHDTICIIEEQIELSQFNGSICRVFELIERCSSSRPVCNIISIIALEYVYVSVLHVDFSNHHGLLFSHRK
jgi:hypothetical protein